MSTSITAYESQLTESYASVESALESLRDNVRSSVVTGAQYGAILTEAQKRHKGDFWTWMQSLVPGVRQEVIIFALRSYKAQMRNPELNDASQLSFALAGGDEASNGNEGHKQQATAFSAFSQAALTLTAKINKIRATPIDELDPAVKTSLRSQLKPLVEFWEALQ